jgi:hypothetical protein
LAVSKSPSSINTSIYVHIFICLVRVTTNSPQ